MDRTKNLACLIALAAHCSPACGPKPVLVVGSKNFTEQVLLGEILAQHIERRLHVPVERKFNLGGTLLAHDALTSGAIDLYPEYTRHRPHRRSETAAFARIPAAVMAQVRAGYRSSGAGWLPPARLQQHLRHDRARRYRAPHRHPHALAKPPARRPGNWAPDTNSSSAPTGWPACSPPTACAPMATPVTMDLGLLYAALKSRKVDLIAANSTDGLAAVLDVTMLEDDRHYFPPYECAVVARRTRWRGSPDFARRSRNSPASSPTQRCANSISPWMANTVRPRRWPPDSWIRLAFIGPRLE